MNRYFSSAIRCSVLLVLAAGLVAGCQKGEEPKPAVSAGGHTGSVSAVSPGGPIGGPPTNEDPEVAEYCKKKGWRLMRDLRIVDRKPTVILVVENRDKPFEDLTITDNDYKMIARSKSVQLLDLRKVKNTDAGLKTVAGIGQLEGISVGGEDVTDAGIKALAGCRSLEAVTLATKKVSDAGVKELAALPKLRWLYLGFMTLTGSGFEPFAGSKTLESVTLEYVDGLTDDGAKNLAKLPNLNELKIGKGFGESKLTAAGIKAIVDTHLPAKFDFDKKLMDDSLLEALVKKGWLYGPAPAGSGEKKPATAADVKSIILMDSKVTDKGMKAVLDCTNATDLFLNGTGVSDETLKQLGAFKALSYLQLGHTKVEGAGLEAVSSLPIKNLGLEADTLSEDAFKAIGKMNALESLNLTDAKMKADWLKHIGGLPNLSGLTLMRTDFDDAAVKHVAGLPNLVELTLNDTKLSDVGFQELLKLPKLKNLLVDGTKVSKEVYQKAKKDHPQLRLYYYRYDQ
jgi:internalin A